eukprot:1139848-Pelagomonas_calceolata.AAC.5
MDQKDPGIGETKNFSRFPVLWVRWLWWGEDLGPGFGLGGRILAPFPAIRHTHAMSLAPLHVQVSRWKPVGLIPITQHTMLTFSPTPNAHGGTVPELFKGIVPEAHKKLTCIKRLRPESSSRPRRVWRALCQW